MNEEKARAILGDTVKEDGGLDNLGHYISWCPSEQLVVLDAEFSADELDAIVWWMRNCPNKSQS